NSDSLIVWGGGHSDYAGNEVYAFNLATLSWTEVTNPSSTAGGDNNGVLSDGTPVSRHTYDGMTFISGTNQMFETSGADAPAGRRQRLDVRSDAQDLGDRRLAIQPSPHMAT